MKSMIKYIILILIAFVFASAQHLNHAYDDSGDNTAYLIDKNWTVYSATISPEYEDPNTGSMVTDLLELAEDCDMDDILNFSSNGEYELDPGDILCDQYHPEPFEFNWAFDADEDTLIIITYKEDYDKTGPDSTWCQILTLSDDTLKIMYEETLDTTIHYNTITYISN